MTVSLWSEMPAFARAIAFCCLTQLWMAWCSQGLASLGKQAGRWLYVGLIQGTSSVFPSASMQGNLTFSPRLILHLQV